MIRKLLSLLLATLLLPTDAAAAAFRAARLPTGSPITVGVVPSLGMGPGAMPLVRPGLAPLSPALQAPRLAPSAPVAPAPLAAAPFRASFAPTGTVVPSLAPRAEPAAQAPSAAQALGGVAAAAAELTARPAGSETDAARADFTAARPQASAADAVVPAGWQGAAPSLRKRAVKTLAAPKPVPPAPSPKSPRGVKSYLSGMLSAQLANNALIVVLPLALLSIGQPASMVGFLTGVTGVFDMAGTLVGGKLADKLGARKALVVSTAARAVALLALPVLLASSTMTLPVAAVLFSVDALARGVADTARNTLPTLLVGKDKPALDKLAGLSQAAFESGAIVGPLAAGLLLSSLGLGAAALAAPLAFAGAAALYLSLPKSDAVASVAAAEKKPASPAKDALKNPWVRSALAASVLLTLYPLKAVLPALFAAELLHAPALSAWLVAAFGVGGTAGALLYNRYAAKLSASSWLKVSAAGALLLAAAWLPGSFSVMAAASALFAAANVLGRLAVTTTLQARLPEGAEGRVTGLQRFAMNAAALGLRFAVGAAFLLPPTAAFAAVGGGVALAAAGQWWLSRRLAALTLAASLPFAGARLSPVHGLPGRLIVVEGLDGSGKSTQLELLQGELKAQGLEVLVTTWNSSDLVSGAVKEAKRHKELTPETFSLLHATDLAERLNKDILPALREGQVVLADRWFFTALARDDVRGMDGRWLRKLYGFAPKPDLTLYFKAPVDVAIGRVLARSEKRLQLSEEFDRPETQPAMHGLKYYEAGLDVKLSEDPVENFRLFQTKVTARYDAQAREFRFVVLDASRGREAQHAEVMAVALERLGDLSSFKKRGPDVPNLFDKDPKDDSEDIRRNYTHPERGVHFYFRNMKLKMQERFAELMDMSTMPVVFLHGSPHLDNYSKSELGAAMVDFDRSRFGPYAWDIVRVLTSMSFRQKKAGKRFLPRDTADAFLEGYLRGFRKPRKAYREMRKLRDLDPEPWESSTTEYLKAGKKWAKEMRKSSISVDDADMRAVLASYLESRGEQGLLDKYSVEEAGKGKGSMGRDRYLVVLAPRDGTLNLDRIFLELKRVRADPDDEWYKNPYDHHGKRMIAAAELYAPGWELRQGWATHAGLQYWGHQLHTQNVKLKKPLGADDQEDFAYAVGSQLGRAHRLSLQGAEPEALEKHLLKHYQDIQDAGRDMKGELEQAYERYMKKLKDSGLKPRDEGSSDE